MKKFAIAMLALAMFVASCGSDSEQAVDFDNGDAVDFGGADLYFLQLDGGRSVVRFDETSLDTVAVTPTGGIDGSSIVSLAAGRAEGVYALVTTETGATVARVSQDEINPLFSDTNLNCLSRGQQAEVDVLRHDDDGSDPADGQTGELVEVDSRGSEVRVTNVGHAHVFCPSWSSDGGLVAFAVPGEVSESFTVPLSLVVGEQTSTLRISNCAIMPGDFNPEATRLAISVSCGDSAEFESGLYVLDVADLDAAPMLLRSGIAAAARWSPDGKWLAYAWGGQNQAEAQKPNASIEVMELETRRYVTVPFLNSAFPIWVESADL